MTQRQMYVSLAMIASNGDMMILPNKNPAMMERASLLDVDQINHDPTAEWANRFRVRLKDGRDQIEPWKSWFAAVDDKQKQEYARARATPRPSQQFGGYTEVPVDESMTGLLARITREERDSVIADLKADLARGQVTQEEYNAQVEKLNAAVV